MCGRFTNKAKKKDIEKEFGVGLGSVEVSPNYNIAPSQMVGAVRLFEDAKEYINLKWGLIPHWSRDASFASKLINARAETLSEKPSFRDAYKTRRCIIPTTGFYEWEKTTDGKQPHFFYMKDKELFGFGGLWEEWLDKETGELIETCTIITTEANAILEPIHERMPVIIEPPDYDNWLDPNEKNLDMFLVPYDAEDMDSYKVSKAVGSPKNNSADLTEKIQ